MSSELRRRPASTVRSNPAPTSTLAGQAEAPPAAKSSGCPIQVTSGKFCLTLPASSCKGGRNMGFKDIVSCFDRRVAGSIIQQHQSTASVLCCLRASGAFKRASKYHVSLLTETSTCACVVYSPPWFSLLSTAAVEAHATGMICFLFQGRVRENVVYRVRGYTDCAERSDLLLRGSHLSVCGCFRVC